MLFKSQIYASFVLVLLSYAAHEISALNYASVNSGDGKFMLQWTYNNSMLMFKLRCKTTGWCSMGFTTTADGRGMIDYDVAMGDVFESVPYLEYFHTNGTNGVRETSDPTPEYKLTDFSEENGYTMLEFNRNATTGDNEGVQFTKDTQVWIVWAFRTNDSRFIYHGPSPNRGIISPQHNLIMEAMSAAIQPSTTIVQPSATMVQPSATMVQPSATMVQPSATTPTTKNAGSDLESRVVTYAILALIACVLHF